MTYQIDFSDPLKTGFQLTSGAYDGPGSTAAQTSLRLYGRGALEWGESVDEDLLRLNENWNSSTPPPNPVGGQLWSDSKYYWRSPTTWYRFDPNASAIPYWTDIGPTGSNIVQGGITGTTSFVGAPVEGSYWYTAAAGPFSPSVDVQGKAIVPNMLYRYDQQYSQVTLGWLDRRSVAPGVGPVDGTDFPQQLIKYYDEPRQEWINIASTNSGATAPQLPTRGTFWWNTTTSELYVWDGTAWILVASSTPIGYVQKAGDTMLGYLTLNANPTAALHAATKQYVDDAITTNLSRTNMLVNGNFDRWDRGGSTFPVTFQVKGNIASNSNQMPYFNGTDYRYTYINSYADTWGYSFIAYTADRWSVTLHGVQAGSGITVTQEAISSDPFPARYFFRATTTATTLAAGTRARICQHILADNTLNTLFGTPYAKDVSLSFWVRSSVPGVYCIFIRNTNAPGAVNDVGGTNPPVERCYIKEYTINVANTWEYKTLTFPGDTSVGNWLFGGYATGLEVNWVLAAGTNHQNTADTWHTGNYHATSNQTQLLSASGRTFDLGQASFVVGSYAPSAGQFEFVPAHELRDDCHFYYQGGAGMYFNETSYTRSWGGFWGAQRLGSLWVQYDRQLRVAPSISGTEFPDASTKAWIRIYHGGTTNVHPTGALSDAWIANGPRILDIRRRGLVINYAASGQYPGGVDANFAGVSGIIWVDAEAY